MFILPHVIKLIRVSNILCFTTFHPHLKHSFKEFIGESNFLLILAYFQNKIINIFIDSGDRMEWEAEMRYRILKVDWEKLRFITGYLIHSKMDQWMEFGMQWFLVIDLKASRSCVIISDKKTFSPSKSFVVTFYETERREKENSPRPPSPPELCFATFSNLFALRLKTKEYLLLFS